MNLQYPIGPFAHEGPVTAEQRTQWIGQIETLPQRMRQAVEGLRPDQLDTSYRPDGWTLRQVVHHVPDSHMNAYIRFKWTLTEAEPRIKAYDEKGWATLVDNQTVPVSLSLALLAALHAKWVRLLHAMTPEQWERRYLHPESGPWTLARALALYAWHGEHHLAHITHTIDREGWTQ